MGTIPPEVVGAYNEGLVAELQLAEIAAQQKVTQIYDNIGTGILGRERQRIEDRLTQTNQSITTFFNDLEDYFNRTAPAQVLFKTLMCNTRAFARHAIVATLQQVSY